MPLTSIIPVPSSDSVPPKQDSHLGCIICEKTLINKNNGIIGNKRCFIDFIFNRKTPALLRPGVLFGLVDNYDFSF
jgi:hypothetical protein